MKIVLILLLMTLPLLGQQVLPVEKVADVTTVEPVAPGNVVPLNSGKSYVKKVEERLDGEIITIKTDLQKVQSDITLLKTPVKKEKKVKQKKKMGDRSGLNPTATLLQRMRSFVGIFFMFGLAILLSYNRKGIWKLSKRVIIGGLAIQFTFAVFVMKIPLGERVFKAMGDGVNKLLEFTMDGSKFIFGPLLKEWSFALYVLPTIIFFSAFMGVLYHLGVMQAIVKVLAKGMAKLLRTSGAESLSATANIFVGQTEAPLVVKPYIDKMTMSEVMTVMVGGFATVAGGVLAAYIGMGVDASSLIAASVMAAPGALVMSKILYPEDGTPDTLGIVEMKGEKETANVIDAAARGAFDGLYLALNVAAMLLAFVALIYGVDYALEGITGLFMDNAISLKDVFGQLFRPLAWMMGIEWNDALHAGRLLGEKIVINEFVAFSSMKEVVPLISERSTMILTFALVGFANFSSIAIQIGGIGSIAPKRKSDLAKLGLKAMLGGTLVALINGCIAGMMM